MNYNDQLEEIRGRMARREQVRAVLGELDQQRKDLAVKVEDLAWVKTREEYDLAKMEGKSFASFFCALLGTREKRLEKEKAEVCAATLKYENARCALEEVKGDILRYESELESLRYVEEEYERMLQKKRDAIKATGSADGEEILAIEQRLSLLKKQKEEIEEARIAGAQSLEIAEQICRELGSAKGFGLADLVGGGALMDILKYDRIQRAQSKIEALQQGLRRFRTELADIATIAVEADLQVGDFLHLADYFFDCVFVDWGVYAKIKDSLQEMTATREKIREALSRLEALRQSGEGEAEELLARLRALEERNTI